MQDTQQKFPKKGKKSFMDTAFNKKFDKKSSGKNAGKTDRKKPFKNTDGKGFHNKNPRNTQNRRGDRGRKDPTRSVRMIGPRVGAFYLLEAVLVDKKSLEFVEHHTLKNIAPKDRGLARMIAYTALRHNTELDLLIEKFVDTEIFTPQVTLFIKVGLTQIVYLDIPDHAAVSETINGVFGKALPSKGMINAVLRRGVEQGRDIIQSHHDIINLPKYLWRSWVNTYGEKPARQMLKSLQHQAPVDISVTSNPKKWAEKLNGTLLPTGGVRLGKVGTVTKLEGFEDGHWWVQDIAAQIPVHIMGDITGRTVIDLCAAPGGKTSQLLARGATVIAVDHNAFRLQRLQQNIQRLGLGKNLTVVLSDAVKYIPDTQADMVLLDAPCSATGTIRKHPDLPFLKDDGLIKSVAKLQRQMLEKARDMVKDNGQIVFATCSLQPEEGEHHMQNLPDGLKIAPIRRREMGDLFSCITPQGTIRTLPIHYAKHGGMDGFFIARLQKR